MLQNFKDRLKISNDYSVANSYYYKNKNRVFINDNA